MYCRFVLFWHNFLTKVLTEVVAAFRAWRWIPLPLLGRILQSPIFAKGYFCLADSMHIAKLTFTCSTSFFCIQMSFVPNDSITFFTKSASTSLSDLSSRLCTLSGVVPDTDKLCMLGLSIIIRVQFHVPSITIWLELLELDFISNIQFRNPIKHFTRETKSIHLANLYMIGHFPRLVYYLP
jgi:hypothetical protein